jgi:hypothetical protein
MTCKVIAHVPIKKEEKKAFLAARKQRLVHSHCGYMLYTREIKSFSQQGLFENLFIF